LATAEPSVVAGQYVEELSSLLVGSRRARARLCHELRCHVEEALQTAAVDDTDATILERIGSPAQIAKAWAVRCERQRARQRRRVGVIATTIAAASLLAAAQFAQGGQTSGASKVRAPVLQPHGIGSIRFGMTKLKTVTELSRVFGTPSARGVNTACSRRYTEVEWGDLVAEFRIGRFSGFRFIEGGYPLATAGSPREASPPKVVFPKLAASTGVSLGSTIAELRASYGRLQRVGADMWRSTSGLIFVDDARRDPTPATSRIVEIKVGTCGDF
jgi:hypothetical protein